MLTIWSVLHGTGATSGIHACALAMAESFGRNVLLTQTQVGLNNMERPLLGANLEKEGFMLSADLGLDQLIRQFKQRALTKEIVDACCLQVTDDLFLLPGTTGLDRKRWDLPEMNELVSGTIKTVEAFCDVLMVDANSGKFSDLSSNILNMSDVVVVVLRQNRDMIEEFLKDDFFADKRCFFLFNQYDPNSKYNLLNIRRLYPKRIKTANSGGILYSTGYMDAISEHKVTEFITRNIRKATDKKNGEYAFIRSLLDTSGKLLDFHDKGKALRAKR